MYAMTHEYAGSRPVIQSRHRTLRAAQAALRRDYRRFRARYPHAYYPSVVRAMHPDGTPGDVVWEVWDDYSD
jgi:hypothetical protein